MRRQRFHAGLIQGHKGVTAVIVPFDTEEVWRAKPTKIGPSNRRPILERWPLHASRPS